jgi:hypothetical protein
VNLKVHAMAVNIDNQTWRRKTTTITYGQRLLRGGC